MLLLVDKKIKTTNPVGAKSDGFRKHVRATLRRRYIVSCVTKGIHLYRKNKQKTQRQAKKDMLYCLCEGAKSQPNKENKKKMIILGVVLGFIVTGFFGMCKKVQELENEVTNLKK